MMADTTCKKNPFLILTGVFCTVGGTLVKLWPPGVGLSHNRGNCFYICLYRKHMKKNHCARKIEINNIVQNQVCKSHGRLGLDEAIIGETRLHVFI
jgi:hypothetical protein